MLEKGGVSEGVEGVSLSVLEKGGVSEGVEGVSLSVLEKGGVSSTVLGNGGAVSSSLSGMSSNVGVEESRLELLGKEGRDLSVRAVPTLDKLGKNGDGRNDITSIIV